MKPTNGFISKGNETKACKLLKRLYGFKQAARSWNHKLHQEFIRQGFKRCKSDHIGNARKGLGATYMWTISLWQAGISKC